MFRSLESIFIKDVEYVLLDDAGEKVYASNLANEYNALLTSNHISLALKEISYPFQRCQLFFDNINIVVYSIDDFFLFFFKDKLLDASVIRQCDVVANKVRSILSI